MTQREKLIVSAYTEVLMTDLPTFLDFASDILQRPIFDCELYKEEVVQGLKVAVKDEFMEICNTDENEGHYKSAKDILMQLMEDENINVRITAVRNSNGNHDILMKAMEDEYSTIRCAAVENCNGDKDILIKAMEDKDVEIRIRAVRNCNGDKDVLMKALEDENEAVRFSAVLC